jgi:trehalose synthase
MISAPSQYVQEVAVAPRALEPLLDLLDPEDGDQLARDAAYARRLLTGRVVWNINSTATGGGVAEMLPSLLAYASVAGIDTRWLVIEGDEDFFRVTKRLHNYLHGDPGDGEALDAADQAAYRATLARNADELAGIVRPGDVAILHDPQTAGLVAALKAAGALVIWRSHVGVESANRYVDRAWDFLSPLVAAADAYVFSRRDYVPPELAREHVEIIPPSIDPLSIKNQELAPDVVRAILARAGLACGGRAAKASADFRRSDLTTGTVERCCDLRGTGPPPDFDTPLVAQISRWDRLKDPEGVLRGFAEHVLGDHAVHLMLAGPDIHSVADDPEGLEVLGEVENAWRALPASAQKRIHLACLPMTDIEENAIIVNALQRRATIVVQKSLQEGFGLTVTEPMWKARPVVASGVGGILDQIEDGQSGLLLPDASDLAEFGRLVRGLLSDKALAQRLGCQARLRVQRHFLVNRHLSQYLRLLERLLNR